MSSINLSYIKPKNTLSVSSHRADLVNAIVEKVKEIDGYAGLKFDNELLIFVCNCIENGLVHKSIDKKELCLEVFDKLFCPNAAEKVILSSSIDFLCSNELIKSIPTLKKYLAIIINYLKKKF